MEKTISIILSVILVLSLCIPAALAADKDCGCGYVPVIYVTGFAQTPLAENVGTPGERMVFMPESGAVVRAVVKLIVPVIALIVTADFDSFAKSVADDMDELFADVIRDRNGDPVNPAVDVTQRVPPSADHTPGTSNVFRYDWREDVFDIARELNDYIEELKRLTGHDRVALRAESMGGAVTMTYLSVYGSGSVDSIVMQSSAFNGITLVGSIFTGDLDVKPASVINYILNFVEGSDNKSVASRLLIKAFGGILIAAVANSLDYTIDRCRDSLYDYSLKSFMGCIPGLWTFVPQEDYEAAKAFMLDEDENARLIAKIDRYHYGVMDRTGELLDSAMEDGVRLAIISNYGKAAVPAITDDGYQSDFLIDTRRTSLGATCAPFGKTLGADYVQAVDDGHNHLSPDGIIDASTCMYPENTWFIKDMMHTWYTRGYLSFAYDFIYSDTAITVFDDPRYPQFMLNDHATGELVPVTAQTGVSAIHIHR